MERPTKDAVEITPLTTTKWCVLVQVVLRRSIRKKENGPRYRNYVVTDTKGTLVPIIMYDRHIDHFTHLLEPYKRYYVSNAVVKDTPEMFKCHEYPYTWTLYLTNLVEPYDDPIPPPLPCTFQFDRFADFYLYADHDKPICIKALVVHTLPIQQSSESTYRECVVINEEMKPMLVRVWEDVELDTDISVYAKYKCPTLIIAYGLNVSTRHGLSLRTKPLSYFMENPPLLEEKPLLEWYNAHSLQITRLIETQVYRDPSRLFHPPRPSEIQPLTFAISTIQNVKALWTEGTITFIPGQQHIWLEACEKCLKQLNVDTSGKIFCSHCKEYTKVTVLYSMGVFLRHGKTLVEASIRSPEIEKLLPVTAMEVMMAAAENKPLTNQIEAALQQKHVICYLKYYDKESKGAMRRRYPILKINTEAEIHEYNAALEANPPAAPTFEENTNLEHIGSSSSMPETPANKEAYTPASQTFLQGTTMVTTSRKEPQADQAVPKRSLVFEDPQVTQAKTLPIQEIQPPISNEQAAEKDKKGQSTGSTHTNPMKKPKTKDNES